MISVGVDPGKTGVAFARCTESDILRVAYVKCKGDADKDVVTMIRQMAAVAESFAADCDVFVVEGQQNYKQEGTKSSAGLFEVAHVAGALLMAATLWAPCSAHLLCPLPAMWKGQVPKEVHHARILSRYSVAFSAAAGYCYPSGCARAAKIKGYQGLNQGDWKHVTDAVGLARWGLDKLRA